MMATKTAEVKASLEAAQQAAMAAAPGWDMFADFGDNTTPMALVRHPRGALL